MILSHFFCLYVMSLVWNCSEALRLFSQTKVKFDRSYLGLIETTTDLDEILIGQVYEGLVPDQLISIWWIAELTYVCIHSAHLELE